MLTGVGVVIIIMVVLVYRRTTESTYVLNSGGERQEWNNSRNYQSSVYDGSGHETGVNGFTVGNPLADSRPGSTDLLDETVSYGGMINSAAMNECEIASEDEIDLGIRGVSKLYVATCKSFLHVFFSLFVVFRYCI